MSGARIPVPANIEREDRILAGLSARQLAILAGAAAVLWLGWQATRDWLPVPATTAIAFPVAAAALAGAFGRADGTTVDRLALAGWRFVCGPRRLVPAVDGVVAAPPWWVRARGARLPAPLRLPARAIDSDGTVDLGRDGRAVLAGCSAVNFALLSRGEREAAVAGYARWLNGLTGPVMVVSRAVPVDLTAWIDRLRHAAAALAPAALAAAAADHAEFLAGLAADANLSQRQVLLAVRNPAGAGPDRARRLAGEAARALAAAGITVQALDGPLVIEQLAVACRPLQPLPKPGAADPGTVITAASGTGRGSW
jgi:hypothetical protein